LRVGQRKGQSRTFELPRATSWLQYDYHIFFTRPDLRPPDPTGEKAFWATIERTRLLLESLSVLGGLDQSRQLELAAMVADYTASHEMHESYRKAIIGIRELSSLLGPRNIAKIKQAASLLRPLAMTLPEHHANAPGVSLKGLVVALDEFLRQLPWRTKSDAAKYRKWTERNHPRTSDPAIEATCSIFWFFVSKCRLPKNEAEVRVAKIGNACLNWDVQYREVYQDPDGWKGCPTVRRRIDRHCKMRSHSLKTSSNPFY
jgi:hypothetical protein